MQRPNGALTSIAVCVKAGAVKEASDKLGLAYFTGQMLEEGTEKYDSASFGEQEDKIAAEFRVNTGYFNSTISVSVPGEGLAPAVDLLSEAVMKPVFPQKEIDIVKKRMLSLVMLRRRSVESLAHDAFLYKIYDNKPQDRQRSMFFGLSKDIASLTRSDIADFYNSYYTPDNTFIAVAGAFKADQAFELLENTFGGWRTEGKGKTAVRRKPEAENKPASAFCGELKQSDSAEACREKAAEKPVRTVYVVDVPGSAQSALYVGCVGFARSTPYFFPLKVMNMVFGGSFMSRLDSNLRERKGFTYGIRSRFDFLEEPGPFEIQANVQTDKTVSALDEIFSEIEAMGKSIPEDELERVRRYICFGYPKSFETSEDLCDRLTDMYIYGLPEDYYGSYVKSIESVDNASMDALRRQFFRNDKMSVVVAGDAKAIEKQIKSQDGWRMEILPVEAFLGPEAVPEG